MRSPGPPERMVTVRQALRAELARGWATAHELSGRVGVPEKQIAAHLNHLERSLRKEGRRLEVEPATCLECDFRFAKRDRLTVPGSCPLCRSERIAPQRFRVS